MRGAHAGKGIRQWLVVLVALLGIVITARLGLWQLDRAQQKLALQAALSDAENQPFLSNAELQKAMQQAQPADVLHRRVQLQGKWLAEHTVFLDNRQMHGKPGFFVLTPFQVVDGNIVLVQRGWAPRNFQNRTELPAVPTAQGVVEIQARIAMAPAQLYALGEQSADTVQPRIRQNLDLTQFAQEIRLPLEAWMLWQTGKDSDGLLRQWPAPDLGVAKHHGYAFQWFALSVLLTALLFWFQFWKPRQAQKMDTCDAS